MYNCHRLPVVTRYAFVTSYICRLQLAALHFNENTNRVQAVTKQGTKRYDLVFPKYKKEDYMVKKILTNAIGYKMKLDNLTKSSTFAGYIKQLMSENYVKKARSYSRIIMCSI